MNFKKLDEDSLLALDQLDNLIIATLKVIETEKENSYLVDVIQTLNSYLKDVKVFYEIGQHDSAIRRLKKCKEIVELANDLKKISEDVGIQPLQDSDLTQVDILDGEPIYTIKE